MKTKIFQSYRKKCFLNNRNFLRNLIDFLSVHQRTKTKETHKLLKSTFQFQTEKINRKIQLLSFSFYSTLIYIFSNYINASKSKYIFPTYTLGKTQKGMVFIPNSSNKLILLLK